MEGFGAAEKLETLSFVNGHHSWRVFDSVHAGKDVIDSAVLSMALDLPPGSTIVDTALIPDRRARPLCMSSGSPEPLPKVAGIIASWTSDSPQR